jgi:hypothetical protein
MTANRCDRCERHIPANGAVCQHLVHGVLLTYNLAAARAEQLPDAACTDCYFTYEREGDVDAVWDKMAPHMLCRNCYQQEAPPLSEWQRGVLDDALADARLAPTFGGYWRTTRGISTSEPTRSRWW